MANRFDRVTQAGLEAPLSQPVLKKHGKDEGDPNRGLKLDLNITMPLGSRVRTLKRTTAEIAREDQEIRAGMLISELPPTQVVDAASTETVHVFGDVDNTIATKIVSDPKLYRKLQAITSPAQAQAWATAERDEGEAPAVRKRQARKAHKAHSGDKDPLDVYLETAVANDHFAATPHPRAEEAATQTGEFVRKHHGGVTKRKDHATIANPTLYKDEAERRQRERYIAAKAPVVDDIDLAEARVNPDMVRAEAIESAIYDFGRYFVGRYTEDGTPEVLDSKTVAKLQDGDSFECGENVPAARRVTRAIYDVHALIAAGEEGVLSDDFIDADGAELEIVSLEALEEQSERVRDFRADLADYGFSRADQRE